MFMNVNSWPEFVAALHPLSEKQKGNAFELLVATFLRTHPTYRSLLESVWLLAEVPDAVRRELNLPGPDEGIDLVARTFAGEYWAIQAKYRTNTQSSITHSELSTFTSLAFVICRGISFGLICTTTERVTELLEGNPRLGFRTSDTWQHLTADIFAEACAGREQVARVPTPTTPWPHQVRALEKGLAFFNEQNRTRGKLISPCASGKTLTAYWLARRLGAQHVVVAVPSLALINQTLTTWLAESIADGVRPDWLCVCSDDSAGRPDRDELLVHVHDLGVPCETEPRRIQEHLVAMRSPLRVVFTTYQSGTPLAAAARAAGITFDFGVFDEAHRTAGRKSSGFAHLLYDANLPIRRRLFMTATERRYAGTSDEIISMDDPELFGETVELLTFKEAIEMRPPVLSDYQVLTIGVKESEIRRLVETNSFVRPDKGKWSDVTAAAFASLIALRRAVSEHGVCHAVSFHSSIDRAKAFRTLSDQFNQAFTDQPRIASFHVSGKMSTGARDRELQAFRVATPSLVTNARCLTEGVDVPRIDCVMFCDPKGSTVDVVQAAGRALRRAQDKTLGHIIVPMVVKDGESLADAVQGSAFKFVMFVLRALAANDERIIEEFRTISNGKPLHGKRIVNFDFAEVLPVKVEAERFVQSIQLQAWGKLAQLAPMSYPQAQELVQRLGLKTQKQWRAWRKGKRLDLPPVPADHPGTPDKVYRGQGWVSWGEFCGTGNVSTHCIAYRPYQSAREFARALGFTSPNQWIAWRSHGMTGKPKRPRDIPSRPHEYYKEEWTGWPDFLGYGKKIGRDWWPFDQARAWVHKLELWRFRPQGGGQLSWKEYCYKGFSGLPSRPDDFIPTAPDRIYAESGWKGFQDWVGGPQSQSKRTEATG
jgi:predicted helicase